MGNDEGQLRIPLSGQRESHARVINLRRFRVCGHFAPDA